MPPRYAYWTILIGDEPTAFRASSLEDIMPTFNRLKEKQPNAVLKWFQNGKLYASRIDAREAMDYRGEKGKRHDPRQKEPGYQGWKGKPAIADGPTKAVRGERAKPDWKPKSDVRPEWKPKGEAAAKPAWKKPEGFAARAPKPEWKPKGEGAKSSWKKPEGFVARPERPRASADKKFEGGKPAWKPRGATGEKPSTFARPDRDRASTFAPRASADKSADKAWKPKSAAFSRDDKPEWKKKPAFGDKKPYGSKPSTFARPDRPRASADKAWKPKGEGFASRGPKPEWKPKGDARPAWQPKAASRPVERREKPSTYAPSDRPRASASAPRASADRSADKDWKPKTAERPAWKPKTAPRSEPSVTGRSDVRDKKWRPGGEHQDPRQKFKDAKKAKWTRFKQAIRARSGHKKKPE